MVRYRQSDNEMMAATHGRGVFTSSSFDCGNAGGCYPSVCRIGDVTVGDIVCDGVTNTYTVTLDISIYNSPGSGMLDVNGQLYLIQFNQADQTVSIDLTGTADGSLVDLNIKFTDSDCEVFRPRVFIAPTEGCGAGITCSVPVNIQESGTYNIPNIASGNGCNTCNSAEHAFWYKFSPTCSGTLSVASCGEGEDTNFYIYSGSSCTNLTQIAASDDDCTMGPGLNNYASEITNIPVSAGVTYYIEWDNKWSAAGFDWLFTFDQSEVIYVNSEAEGTGTGCSWANAMTDLNQAIAQVDANSNFSEIWVMSGFYNPGSERNSTFLLSQNIKIYGGFAETQLLGTVSFKIVNHLRLELQYFIKHFKRR